MASVTITIDNAQAMEFFEKFILYHPKPDDYTGTDIDWVKEWLIKQLYWAYKQGVHKQQDLTGIIT